jgi:hypothetical protein
MKKVKGAPLPPQFELMINPITQHLPNMSARVQSYWNMNAKLHITQSLAAYM